MPASSEWKAAQQSARDGLEAAKVDHAHYEQELFKSKQELDAAYAEAREMEDEAKQRVAEARLSLQEVKESCRELKKNAKDELEDARRRAEPTERRLAESRATYNTINNSKPEFVGTWDRMRSGRPLDPRLTKVPISPEAERVATQLRHNLELHKQGRHDETPASGRGVTRPSELQRLRREATEMGNNSMTADLDAELAALERMNAQGDPG